MNDAEARAIEVGLAYGLGFLFCWYVWKFFRQAFRDVKRKAEFEQEARLKSERLRRAKEAAGLRRRAG